MTSIDEMWSAASESQERRIAAGEMEAVELVDGPKAGRRVFVGCGCDRVTLLRTDEAGMHWSVPYVVRDGKGYLVAA